MICRVQINFNYSSEDYMNQVLNELFDRHVALVQLTSEPFPKFMVSKDGSEYEEKTTYVK